MAPRLSTWDHKSDKDLLLTIIEMGTLKSIMWPEIAERMTAKGYTFTKEACRQHFQKIRKESATGKSTDSDSPARAPKPRFTPKTTPSKSTPQKRGMTQKDFEEEDDDEEEMSQSAVKRQKMKLEEKDYGYGNQTAPLFKMEDLNGNSRDNPKDLERDDLYLTDYV